MENVFEHLLQQVEIKLNLISETQNVTLKQISNEERTTNQNKNKSNMKHSIYCMKCDRKFLNFPQLNSHLKFHKYEKIVKQIKCSHKMKDVSDNEKTLNDKRKLNKQIVFLNQSQSSSNQLKLRKPIHSGVNLLRCDQCEYSSNRIHNLTIHKRIHTGERPFQCNQCEYKSTTSSQLRRHERIHSGERPFECDQCEKKFTRLHHLIRHKKIHTKEKPFECDQCEFRCARSDTLKSHKQTHLDEIKFLI